MGSYMLLAALKVHEHWWPTLKPLGWEREFILKKVFTTKSSDVFSSEQKVFRLEPDQELKSVLLCICLWKSRASQMLRVRIWFRKKETSFKSNRSREKCEKSTEQVNLLIGWIQTSKTGGQPYKWHFPLRSEYSVTITWYRSPTYSTQQKVTHLHCILMYHRLFQFATRGQCIKGK